MSIARFSLNQRVLVNLLFVAVLVVGAIVATEMPVEAYPNIAFAEAKIDTRYNGASAADIERLITRPIEDEIADLDGASRFTSYSQRNLSTISVKWREDLSETEHARALDDLRAALDRVTDLPADADRPEITEVSVDEILPLMQVVVFNTGNNTDVQMRDHAEAIRRDLTEVEGVARVRSRLLRDRELHVLLDAGQLDRLGLTVTDIASRIRATSLDAPGGTLEIDPREGASDGNTQSRLERASAINELTLTVSGRYNNIKEAGDTIVARTPDGLPVRLHEIATIEPTLAREILRTRFNGRPSLMLGVIMEPGENALRVAAALRARIAQMQANGKIPHGVEITTAIDSTQIIESRTTILTTNLAIGLVLVAIILWAMLGFRNAMLAIVGIPFAFVCTLVFLQAIGVSINALSLFALVLATGLVVDDAIVVLENIYRRVEEGLPIVDAIVKGTDEVLWPVVASVSTTIAAFMPLLMAEGLVGRFFQIIPQTVCAVLVASLFECLIILPVHYLDFGRRRKAHAGARPSRPLVDAQTPSHRADEGHQPATHHTEQVDPSTHGGDGRAAASISTTMGSAYERVLRRAIQLRYLVIGAVVATGALFFALAGQLGIELYPSDFQICEIAVRMPNGSTLDQTQAACEVVEGIIADMPEGVVKDHLVLIGYYYTDPSDVTIKPSIAMFNVEFHDSPEVRSDPDYVVNELRGRIEAAWNNGAFAAMGMREAPTVTALDEGPPQDKPIYVRIESANLQQAAALAHEIEASLRSMDGVRDISNNLEPGGQELRLRLREPHASRAGLSVRDVALTLATANEGDPAAVILDPTSGERMTVKVRLRPEDRRSIADLLDVRVASPLTGARLRIGDVADLIPERGNERVFHYNGRRTVVVRADVDATLISAQDVNLALGNAFADAPARYPGLRLALGGGYEETQRTFESIGRAFIVALLLIYLILAAQFRSFVQPVLIMLTIPFGFVGVVFALWLGNLPVTITAQIAVVGLAGVIVNGALVLVTFINAGRRKEGLTTIEAVVKGSRTRLRPVLLTALTTVFGLAPMALGITGYSKLWSPFAMALMSGITFATVLTLVFVPCAYVINEELLARLRRLFRRRVRAT